MIDDRILKIFNGGKLINNDELRAGLREQKMSDPEIAKLLHFLAGIGEISSYLDEGTGLIMWEKRA